jgi:hypothetical protein
MMIGQHPDLAGLPELKLFAFTTLGRLAASLPESLRKRGVAHRSPGLVRALAQLEFGGQSEDALRAAETWLSERSHWSGAQVLDVLLAKLAPRRAVEKSPEHVVSTAPLRRLKAAYPGAQYLHVTRHPLTTQTSMIRYRTRASQMIGTEDERMAAIAAWLDAHLRILSFTSRLPPGGVMRIRAEDILNAPLVHLREIARWLGVRTDLASIEAMLHPENSVFAHTKRVGNRVLGGLDPAFLQDPSPHEVELPPVLEKPVGCQAELELWQAAAKVARRFGY